MKIRKLLGAILVAVALASVGLASVQSARAQDYPAKGITYIMPFAAGGGSDLIGRVFAKELSARINQPVVVDNRVGATGIVGLDALTRATPDGYTVMQLANATVVALLFQNRTLDVDKAFTAIGNIQIGTTMIAVNPANIGARNLQELIAVFKSRPNTTFTSSGQGSQSHLMMAGLAKQLGVSLTHVPYKGNGPAITDVVAGRVDFILTDAGSLKPHLLFGALRAIVTTSSVRSPVLPDLPMASEQGYPEFKYDPVSSVIAPPGMSGPVLDRLRSLVQQTATSAAFANAMRDMGYKNEYMDGPTLRKFMADEYSHWGNLIRDTGIKPD